MDGLKSMFQGGIWFVDTEFHPKDGIEGNLQEVVCLVAKELFAGETMRLWKSELNELAEAPFPIDESALFVAFFATAELNSFISLGWKLPKNVLDLFVEFRVATNGLNPTHGNGLLGAMLYLDIAGGMVSEEKDQMRDLILSGGPWSDTQIEEILSYCESDVNALEKLFKGMINEN